ncbi:MAG: sigma 54-interacting transcriptional regulator [Polyangiaceae bacterium]
MDPDRDLSDLEQSATAARPRYDDEPRSTTFVLTVVEGTSAGKSFTIDAAAPPRLLLGQGPACELRLEDRQVSRRHAALERDGHRLRITDLRSTNGTFVDGVAVVEAWLSGDETVRVGGSALRVDRGPPEVAPAPRGDRFGRVIGESQEMRALYPLFQRLAVSNVPVIIEGETGTGKEVLAEALHEAGPRASGPFVVFDCTAVPPNLVESELFGHERGAFTGAVASRRGVFEQAQGGTLLIDEIGDLDVSLQPKLLRAIERSEIRKVGSDRSQRVDVRVLAATRRDLDHEVQEGRFRDDLFHRLAVGRVELPPLRRRRGDVAVLGRHFWNELGGDLAKLDAELLQRWEDTAWPGNVRQLRNSVARRLALGDLPTLTIGDDGVPSSRGPGDPHATPAADDFLESVIAEKLPLPLARMRVVEEFERRYIATVLAEHGGNVVHAAKASGIARRYFQILRGGRRR